MSLFFGDAKITNIDNLVPQSGLDITDMWFGTTNVFTVWAVYDGALPATLNANGDDMRQYQIYGNTGGVGEEVNITGLIEPLCGIGTYTDSLDLSTGMLTRRINKVVLTGKENWQGADNSASKYLFDISNYKVERGVTCVLTHYRGANNVVSGDIIPYNSACFFIEGNLRSLYLKGSEPITLADFKSYLAAQYAAGTPVTVWYVLAVPVVSTITVPSGLTGTIEGYLIQDGTPTPETPIYPTANGVKQADDAYSIKYGYKLDISTEKPIIYGFRSCKPCRTGNLSKDLEAATVTPIYIGSDPLGKDEYIDYQAGKVYRMINGTLTPTDPPVPLPALPMCNGKTIVDYAGESQSIPEKVLLKYRKEGF